MNRFGTTLVLATILFGGQAWAGQATIKAVSGAVQVGKDGAWKAAAPGMSISDSDFVKIPESAKATITLGDNTVKDFLGKAIVPGRRLATEKSAGMMQLFTQGVQKISGASDATTAANGITKAGEQGEKAKLAHKDKLNFRSTSAADAEKDFSAGRYSSAKSEAEEVLKESTTSAADSARAHLILGKVLAREGDTLGAIKDFDLAVTTPPATNTAFDALLQRGQAYGQIGEDEKAQTDLKALLVPDVSASREQVDQARFLLGVMAVEANDRTAAKTYFDALSGGSKPLYDAGMAMLASK